MLCAFGIIATPTELPTGEPVPETVNAFLLWTVRGLGLVMVAVDASFVTLITI